MLIATENGMLHETARRGIICLIPKKERDPLLVKIWRPIMLLNTDYKILAKLIAIRMKTILDDIISPCQTGHMEGRFIDKNLHKLIDIIEFVENEQIAALYISIDFEKCFDTIEVTALEGALRYFNFGDF